MATKTTNVTPIIKPATPPALTLLPLFTSLDTLSCAKLDCTVLAAMGNVSIKAVLSTAHEGQFRCTVHIKDSGVGRLPHVKISGIDDVVGSFENSYIPENPRTPPISYISQTVIPFKKPTSEPFKTFRMNKIR
ncbi:hypothetical protein LXL04_033065 [Taraxacum kok-saghyz]